MGLGLRKEDTVMVLSGKDKGKRGRVISVLSGKDAILIERVNMIKKHQKPNAQFKQGGIIEKEAPLHVSKVVLVCPKCSAPTRIGNEMLEDGRKLRTCKKCKEVIDR
jgi:large subunit ribosomal protein L24